MKRFARRSQAVAAAFVLALGLAGCGGGSSDSSSSGGSGGSGGVEGNVTVFAAASLTDAFNEIGRGFERKYPEADVKFSYAGSSDLARQINQGAPAGVFASANEDQMQVVVDAGNTKSDPTVFVQNMLQIAVPAGNPAKVKGLQAFAKPGLKLAICAKEVPCGAAAQEAFTIGHVKAKPDTLEKDVKAVLTKVSLGEADAGLVYVTDVTAAGDKVQGIDFPEAKKAINDYPIAVLKDAPNPDAAQAFTDYVLSGKGKKVLKEYGFVTDVS